ncbi:MAG: hypothetical protein GY803_31510 [Chloroflexi bacterium]|nr:hypothetical protein [Chloroflexota bacterium]
MKRSLLLVLAVVFAFVGVYSLTTFFTVLSAQAVLVDGETAVTAQAVESSPSAETAVTVEPHILLTKNPLYYDVASVSIDSVLGLFLDENSAWNRYQGGEFDTIPLSLETVPYVKDSPYASDLVTTTQLATSYYGFMNDVPPFNDPLVRAAFASALNRPNMIAAAGGDQISTLTLTPPGAFGYVDGVATGIGRPYSTTAAMDLLTASGYTGIPTITMMVHNSQQHIDMANAACQEWFATLGISVTLEVKEWPEYLDLLDNGAAADRPGIFRLGWAADYPDANNFHNDLVLGINRFRYINPAYDALVTAAMGETDLGVRADLYKQAESYLVMTDTAMAPIYNYVNYDLTRPTLNRTYRNFGGQHFDEWDFPVPETLEIAGGEPRTLDPVFVDEPAAADYVEQLFLGLTDTDPATGAVVPELAISWDVFADGMVYIFTMRSDALWTDGNPVTAYDAEYGIQRAFAHEAESYYAQLLRDAIVTVQALDATHIRFDLSQPRAYFPSLLALGAARPQPQWAIEAFGDDWTQPGNIVSNGPYMLVEWELTAPYISSVQPSYADNSMAISMTINGNNFQPGAAVSLDQIPLDAVNYISDTQLEVSVPAAFTPDTYDVWVKNPNGKQAVLLDAFTVLPADQPAVIFGVSPPQGPDDVPVIVDIFGENFIPGSWISLLPGDYSVGGIQYINSSHLRAVVPPSLPTGVYTLRIVDPNENFIQLPNAYEVFDSSANTDLYADVHDFWISPLSTRVGDTVQLGLNVHRQGGVTETVDVDFYIGALTGNPFNRSQALQLPANEVRSTIPIAWTPPNAGLFTLYAVIDPDGAERETREDNNVVSRTVMVLPPLFSDVTPPVITAFTINDGATAVSQRQVALDATATDTGSGVESILFVEYEYIQSAGAWVPIQASDWLPYADNHIDYPWALLPSPGVHYLQAWTADAAGNVSAPFSRFISYQPDTIDISAGQVHVYREALTSGEDMQVRLTVLGGDPLDFYVWKPDSTVVQAVERVSDSQEIAFTADQDGVFQIEVEAKTGSAQGSAQYRLEIIRSGPAAEPTAVPTLIDGTLGVRATPYLLPGDEPDDDVGLPSAPSSTTSVLLPIILRD